ncbi:amino acid decarboxylase [Solirubrobacter sp. CPCC 204708]|uniref:Amino acid decarboxylase n=1 Tax=Solirubrobacter deserti TaxID=2282478 RepID=A0ABT4RI31_9ACTN|nr:amino acid decarboxylase [Solirubrobacter deserti]MBE2316472.1 amino acid decarboxylase [Solirubrobacter deserti]MDA0138006.1 amino acid decarboxylase [Solirubrobacter deserti]
MLTRAMASPDQPTAPYLDAVVAYGFRGSTRFHVPGHKAGNAADLGVRTAFGWQTHRLDIPQDIHGVDLGPSPTPYERAEELAAEAYGAERSWFLTNGATQGNHALCLALAPLGAPVVVQRNAHASVVDGLVLSGGLPTWVAPEYEPVLGMAHGVTAEAVARALEATPGARAVFIVSPTYYGMAADIEECARVAHAAGVPLVVDQSWGPHLGFHEELPAGALELGADAMLTSVHKIAGSLTQSALLHVSSSGRVDPEAVARTLRLVRSTSPSSLLMASLDGARRQLVLHGEALLGNTIALSRRTCAAIDEIPGCRVIGDEQVGRPGVAGRDPLRIVIDVRGTGATGYEMAAALRSNFDTQVELATQATIVLVLGLDEPPRELERFIHDLTWIARRMERPGETEEVTLATGTFENEVVVAPREAFLGASEIVGVDDAVGRVSAEAIAGYPPGIPVLLPGERITDEVVAYLRSLKAVGARLHGASDPEFGTVHVLAQ